MSTDTHVMVTCEVRVNGERIASRQLVPVEAWEDERIRDHIVRSAQLAVADKVVERLSPEVVAHYG